MVGKSRLFGHTMVTTINVYPDCIGYVTKSNTGIWVPKEGKGAFDYSVKNTN